MLLVLPAVSLAILYLYLIGHWRAGFQGLLFLLPFTGLPILLLPSPLGVLFKDLVLVIPTYLGFSLWLHLQNKPLRGVPPALILAMLGLTTMVLVQLSNPGIPTMLVGIIGAKVWLFYLPIYFVAYAYCETEHEVIKIGRILVALSFLPTGLGLLEFALSLQIGYERTMTMIYGSHAEAFTQRFSQFQPDSGMSLFRIPSTFPFATHYFDFIMGIIPVAFFLMNTDPNGKWRTAARISLPVLIAAGLTSGSRQAFIFLPLELVILILLTNDLRGAIRRFAVIGCVSFVLIMLLWTRISILYNYESDLFGNYTQTIAEKGLEQAISEAPLGKGTGTNTGAARYAFTDDVDFSGIENYYAKAAYELGVLGLAILAALFAGIVLNGLTTLRFAASRGERIIAGSLVAFFVTVCLNSFKGWALDLDPLNVYFWLFAGMLAKLPYLV